MLLGEEGRERPRTDMDVQEGGSEQGQIARWLASYFKGKQSTVFAAVVRACHLDVNALSASASSSGETSGCKKRSHSDYADSAKNTDTHKRQRLLLHNNSNNNNNSNNSHTSLPPFSSYSSANALISPSKQSASHADRPNENTSPTKRTWSSSGLMEISPRKLLLQRSPHEHVSKRAARGVSLPG